MTQAQIESLFAGKPQTRAIYERLSRRLRPVGAFTVEPKKTCLHLVNGSAFAGVHPRKDSILLTIRTAKPIKSRRVRKSDQASANRCYNDLVLSSPDDVDAELIGWLREGYGLGVKTKAYA